ncbi:type II secretion system protein [Eubacterium aggregans]|uniref:type II secretion system protein n=1 Tax=Eubacterium aggregans TaxID=81409 RepID=UPI003F398579
MKDKRNNRGFTLVEIIVTLVILAVLAAFTIPAMLGWVSNSREKFCQIARYDIQRYYKTQAVGDRPTTEVAAKVVLQKAIVNSYGDSKFYSDTNNAIGICPSGGEYPLNDTNIKYTESDGIFCEVADITCTKHGNIRPNLTSTKSVLE